MKLVFLISCLLIGSESCICLRPANMPSGKGRRYRPTTGNPEKDLNLLTGAEASFVSKHWLNNILQHKNICKEDKIIVENINKLEAYIQESFSVHEVDDKYIAWIPPGFTKDILFIVVLETTDDEHIVKLMIHSPFWEPAQIESHLLLDALKIYSKNSNKTLELTKFLDENIRYKLEWKYLQDRLK